MINIIHFWPTSGGMGNRLNHMFLTLQNRHSSTFYSNEWRDIKRCIKINEDLCVYIIFTSLLTPLLGLMKLRGHQSTMLYMVRGDEVKEALFKNKRIRAIQAFIFQKLAYHMKVKFVFVSWDLQKLFAHRYGVKDNYYILPNTLGEDLTLTRNFDGNVAVVGDFNSLKNIEYVLQELHKLPVKLHIYGNTSLPREWVLGNVVSHGVVKNLKLELRSCSLLVLSSITEGYPNVINEALASGCAVITPRTYPFAFFPLNDRWKYDLRPNGLKQFILNLQENKKWNYDEDNSRLREIIAQDWGALLWNILNSERTGVNDSERLN